MFRRRAAAPSLVSFTTAVQSGTASSHFPWLTPPPSLGGEPACESFSLRFSRYTVTAVTLARSSGPIRVVKMKSAISLTLIVYLVAPALPLTAHAQILIIGQQNGNRACNVLRAHARLRDESSTLL